MNNRTQHEELALNFFLGGDIPDELSFDEIIEQLGNGDNEEYSAAEIYEHLDTEELIGEILHLRDIFLLKTVPEVKNHE